VEPDIETSVENRLSFMWKWQYYNVHIKTKWQQVFVTQM